MSKIRKAISLHVFFGGAIRPVVDVAIACV